MPIEISFKKQNTAELKKEITLIEAKDIIQKLNLQVKMDIVPLIKKIVSNEADGFSINKDHPYSHLYIGNGSENVLINFMTLEKETKMLIPKSFFED